VRCCFNVHRCGKRRRGGSWRRTERAHLAHDGISLNVAAKG
jgi:hypothetical protein